MLLNQTSTALHIRTPLDARPLDSKVTRLSSAVFIRWDFKQLVQETCFNCDRTALDASTFGRRPGFLPVTLRGGGLGTCYSAAYMSIDS